MKQYRQNESILTAGSHRLAYALLALSLTVGALLGSHAALAAELILDGNNVIGIKNLTAADRLGDSNMYDVEFVYTSGRDVYTGGAVEDFQFPVEEDAILALDAVMVALNGNNPRPTGAGPLGTDQFFIGVEEKNDIIGAVGSENLAGQWALCEDVCEDGIALLPEAAPVTYAIFWPPGYLDTDPPTDSPVSLSGRVENSDEVPLCAMVLASGKYTFSCDGSGNFSLGGLAREPDGSVKRQVYVDGFFPKIDVLQGSTTEVVVMERSGACPDYNAPSNPGNAPDSAGKRVDIRGSVLLGNSGDPVCAMVLANGQYMFSCDGSGNYNLNIPLDENGQFKLQVYADGFAPYTSFFGESNLVNDVRLARAAECR